jgi:hypothetical protein
VAITDRREIAFDLLAVKLALQWSPRAAQAFGLPPMAPTSVRCNPVDGHVEVIYGVLSAARVFAVRAEALGAILISYCNRAGMPMPRGADKGIRVERDTIVVTFTMQVPDAVQPEVPEGAVAHAPEAIRAWSWIEPAR